MVMGVTPSSRAHIVGFGKDEHATFVPEKNPERALYAFGSCILWERTEFHFTLTHFFPS